MMTSLRTCGGLRVTGHRSTETVDRKEECPCTASKARPSSCALGAATLAARMRWTVRFPGSLLFVFPGSLLFVFPATCGAHPTLGSSIAMTSHGVELSLLLPRRTYPRNALVSTTVTLRNVSKHVVHLTTSPSINGSQGPQVSVLDARRNVVYPPALQKLFRFPNPSPGQLRLRPGEAYQTQMYVILRAAHLEAEALVQDPWRRTIRTHVLTVRLMASKSPQVGLHIVSGSTYAEVRPMAAVRGPLLYMSAAISARSLKRCLSVARQRCNLLPYYRAVLLLERRRAHLGEPVNGQEGVCR